MRVASSQLTKDFFKYYEHICLEEHSTLHGQKVFDLLKLQCKGKSSDNTFSLTSLIVYNLKKHIKNEQKRREKEEKQNQNLNMNFHLRKKSSQQPQHSPSSPGFSVCLAHFACKIV